MPARRVRIADSGAGTLPTIRVGAHVLVDDPLALRLSEQSDAFLNSVDWYTRIRSIERRRHSLGVRLEDRVPGPNARE